MAGAPKRSNVDPSLVEEVYLGNILCANFGPGPARQATLGAGIPNTVVSTSVNKVCASGMKDRKLHGLYNNITYFSCEDGSSKVVHGDSAIELGRIVDRGLRFRHSSWVCSLFHPVLYWLKEL
ncbi:hypothetical protein L1987_32791 [Smallanthus sonchifolius]|uniref:Uncharacterized protein n=1 Tax=Smallanthus sonchifolius TaxID=185202 RepID=A0ACB9HQ25_9ASTR|nr:hypothetical protein L1987_32791 [Smallanthus sonchifolius]